MTPETITGVALLCDDGRLFALPRPHRHFHLFAIAAFVGNQADPCTQGFMTSAGRFVGRTEAKEIVRASDQDYNVGFASSNPELYSEDVW